jgi:hypothetical protein
MICTSGCSSMSARNLQQKTETEGTLIAQSVKPDVRWRILPVKRSTSSTLVERLHRSYRGSLLRLVLRGLCSCYHRMRFERSLRGTLRDDAVRRSVPLVPCSDSRNEMQFCTRSIQSLERVRPYMTLADGELFLQGWFQAARWYAHLDSESRKAQQSGSSAYPDEPDSMPLPAVQQSTRCGRSSPLPSRE